MKLKYVTLFFFVLVPPVLLLFLVWNYGVNIPFQDQWDFIPILEKSYKGTVTLTDLWTQHNEHRPLFPRLLMLGLAHLTHWNIRYEMFVSFLFAVGIFAILSFHLKQSRWLIPVVSIFVFSLTQWENWLWGWQMQIFLNVFAVTLGFSHLSTLTFRWHRFLGSLILGSIALFSFANGIVYFPIQFWLIISIKYKTVSQKINALLVWSIWSAGMLFLYFFHYTNPADSPNVFDMFSDLFGYVLYVFTYLGTPIAGNNSFIAFYAGIISIIVFFQIRNRFLVSLGLYAVGSALITGLGRIGFGYELATISRYTTISQLLWIANAAFLFHIKSKRISRVGIFVIVFFTLFTSLSKLPVFYKRHEAMTHAQKVLLENTQDPIIRILYPNPDIVRERKKFLEEKRLSLYYENR